MKTIITIVLILVCIYFLLSAFPETRPILSDILSAVGIGSSGSNERQFISEETSYMDIILGAGSFLGLIINIARNPKK